MFDAIAPRYDLVNRIMTFRMDVGWRRKTVRSLGLPRVVHGARPGVRHRRPVPRAGVEGARARSASTCPSGCWPPPAPTRRCVHGDALRLPLPDGSVSGVTCGFALRNFASLPPFFAELARVVRPGGRVALLEVAEPPNRLLRAGHGFYFGKVVPLVGGLLSDPAAYRYLPRSVAYLPEPAVMLDAARGGRVRRRRPAAPVGRHRPADHRHAVGRRMTDARRHAPGGSTTTSTCWRWPGATACSSSAAAPAWPGGAWRRECPLAEADAVLAGDRDRRRGRRPGHRPGRLRRAPLPRRPAHRAGGPGGGVGPRRRRHPVGHDDRARRRAERRTWPSRPPDPLPAAVVGDRRSPSDRPSGGASSWPGPRRRCATRPRAGSARSCWRARCASRPTCRSTGRSSSSGCGASYPGCFLFHVDGFLGASPELLVSRTGDVVRAQPMAGTAPAAATRRPTPGSPPACWRRRPTGTSTRSPSTWCSTRCIPWCSYLDYEPEPSVVGVANVQHLATMVEGRLSQPAPSILELVAALHPTPAVNGWPRDEARGVDRGQRGLRPRPLRRHRRLGRRPRQRHLRGQHPLRRHRRHDGPPRRRQRHRRRQRPRHRAGRDPGQAPSHAQRPRHGSDPRRSAHEVVRPCGRSGTTSVELATASATAALRRWWTSTLARRSVRATRTWTPPFVEGGSDRGARRRRPRLASTP